MTQPLDEDDTIVIGSVVCLRGDAGRPLTVTSVEYDNPELEGPAISVEVVWMSVHGELQETTLPAEAVRRY